jgi:integrase
MTKVSEAMKRAPGVHQRPGSSIWHWGIKAPKDLQKRYPGQWAHRGSLNTSDLRTANERAAVLRAQWLTRFAQQREAGTRQAAGPAPILLTPELIREAADLMHARMLESDETVRMAGLNPTNMETQALALELEAAQLKRAYATGSAEPVENILPNWLMALGMEVSAADPLRPALARELVKARLRAIQARQSRHSGELVETPPEPQLPALGAIQGTAEVAQVSAPAGVPKNLREVFTRWKAAKTRSPDSVNACDRSLALFEEKFGHPRLKEISRATGDAFRAHLLTLDLASKTKHDRMTWVKSLLKYARRDLEVIPSNPWEGLDVAHKTENRRMPWKGDQLRAFFELPLFTAHELPKDSKAAGAAAYWIPLLGLFTGARVGELCQLRVADIEQTEAGAFLHITEEAEGATVKTEAGLRSVPIHSELVRLGFLGYVDAMKASASTILESQRMVGFVSGSKSAEATTALGPPHPAPPAPGPAARSASPVRSRRVRRCATDR